jgi:hypothetical protein
MTIRPKASSLMERTNRSQYALRFDLLSDTRSVTPSSLCTPVKLRGDQSLVPPQEGVGGDEGCYLLEALATERVSERRETAAFGVSKPQAATAEVRFEDAIVLKQIGNHLLLIPLQPAGNHGDEHVEDHGVPQVKSRAVRARSSILSTWDISRGWHQPFISTLRGKKGLWLNGCKPLM